MSERRFSRVFWMVYGAARKRPRIISQCGGTRSGKTYSTLQFLHELIPRADVPGDVTSVVSETMPHLKRGAIRDFESNLGHPLSADPNWNATDCIYTYANGARLEFFSADNPAKVLGPARKRLFVNECNHIGYDTYRQLAVRTRGLILLDYNPASTFWAIEKVETRPNCITLHTTYLDNIEFLTPEQVEEIESNREDANWWRVYGQGLVGQLDGLIYDLQQVDELPEGGTDIYGMDFGFTHDPTAIVHIRAFTGRKELYLDEVCYRTRMLNSDIVAELERAGVPKRSVPIYADCAEPKSIEEIARAGFNVLPCDKDAPVRSDKLKFQLQWMQGWKLYVTKRSLDIIREGRNYCWAKDRDGNPLNYPIDSFNHALDAARYGAYTHLGARGSGEYHISPAHGYNRRRH